MKASTTLPHRTRNGRQLKKDAQGFLLAWAVPILTKLLTRKSVLIAIGLGTLASWYVRYRFSRPKPRRFRLF